MNQVKFLKKLTNLSYFNKNTLSQFIPISDNSLYADIQRWLKSGRLIPLKKGLYVTPGYLSAQTNIQAYTEFIANTLREPSYLSMDYVLQKYNILSESVYALTSVTLKSKRMYRNKLGVFIYRNINERLFTGFKVARIDDRSIKIATKAKALFDFFYYKLFRIKKVDANLIESFRLNLDELAPSEFNEFCQYCQNTRIKKMMILPEIIRMLP